MKIPASDVIALARGLSKQRFYAFARLKMPTVYLAHRKYLETLCDTLQDFIEDKLLDANGVPYQKLMINMPPRHGKSVSIIQLCQWVLGKYPDTGIITASYNELLSSRMAKAVRDGIQEVKGDPLRLVYSDVFPNTKIKQGDGAAQLWAIEGRHFSYLATSPGGTMTGIGAKLLIVDDLIKNFEEACNERVLDEHWEWYQNTVKSRLESGAKEIMVMTRWATGDLCGKLQANEPGQWYIVKEAACLNEASKTMLAPDILSYEEFDRRRSTGDAQLIQANYQQEPYDSNDKLYPEFKEYAFGTLPTTGTVEAYIDTADEGKDFLAGAVYRVSNNTAYILDIIYTQDPMEKTEGQTAHMLASNRCQTAHIESNNGGRGFARNVERIMREIAGYSGCMVKWFHQGENKQARILSNSTNVVNSVIFPVGWKNRWPEFYRDISSLSRMSKWTHDDAPDMLTGIVEKSITKAKLSVPTRRPAGL